ncbi:hypothetical protein PBRA_005893 [Plasmodiophora brassicae]|uniref:Uncharacterized protein n=1 Tax=Plasmodiophora brassicae TaxID=37360 RepID=A0A0G4IRK4_PLABS|nr:hypothetical protein PBRA_005893 [Plasmodiophora brassicae]
MNGMLRLFWTDVTADRNWSRQTLEVLLATFGRKGKPSRFCLDGVQGRVAGLAGTLLGRVRLLDVHPNLLRIDLVAGRIKARKIHWCRALKNNHVP